MDDAIKLVSINKSRMFNSRPLQLVFEEIGSKFSRLLLAFQIEMGVIGPYINIFIWTEEWS